MVMTHHTGCDTLTGERDRRSTARSRPRSAGRRRSGIGAMSITASSTTADRPERDDPGDTQRPLLRPCRHSVRQCLGPPGLEQYRRQHSLLCPHARPVPAAHGRQEPQGPQRLCSGHAPHGRRIYRSLLRDRRERAGVATDLVRRGADDRLKRRRNHLAAAAVGTGMKLLLAATSASCSALPPARRSRRPSPTRRPMPSTRARHRPRRLRPPRHRRRARRSPAGRRISDPGGPRRAPDRAEGAGGQRLGGAGRADFGQLPDDRLARSSRSLCDRRGRQGAADHRRPGLRRQAGRGHRRRRRRGRGARRLRRASARQPHEYSEAPAKYLTAPNAESGDPALRFEIGADRKVSLIHVGTKPVLFYVEGCA